MTLSDWLIVLSLAFVVYGVGRHAWDRLVAPRRAARAAESVKPSRRSLAFKQRSKRSNVQNAVNAGSQHQDASSQGSNVQPVAAAPAPPAAPAGDAPPGSEGFTLSPRELAQLGEALSLYREGATQEAAICKAFGVTKGAGEGWKRGKALFDAATVAPGAAPAGTYAAPAAPARRRVARRAS